MCVVGIGNIIPMDVVVEYNKRQQVTDVKRHFNKFEELCFYLLIINLILNEPYFVYCFVGGLNPDLQSMVRASNPSAKTDAPEIARQYKKY